MFSPAQNTSGISGKVSGFTGKITITNSTQEELFFESPAGSGSVKLLAKPSFLTTSQSGGSQKEEASAAPKKKKKKTFIGYKIAKFEISGGQQSSLTINGIHFNEINDSGSTQIEGLNLDFEPEAGAKYTAIMKEYSDGSYKIEITKRVVKKSRSVDAIVESASHITQEEIEEARENQENLARILRVMGGKASSDLPASNQSELDFNRVKKFNMTAEEE